MKILIALSTSALVLAACATEQDTRVAQADCRVAPIVTADSSLRKDRVTDLDQRYAEMQLATSDYRMRHLRRDPTNNNVEDALAGCSRK